MLELSVNERFDAKVDRSNPDGCWEWTGALNKNGYGKFKERSYVLVQSHRFAYQRAHGAIPTGMMVCHHCDNPRCVRPDHLFAGTALDNVRDMLAKGRHPMSGRVGMGRTRTSPRVRPTECPQGHPYDEQNTYVYKRRRICRECKRQYDRTRTRHRSIGPARRQAITTTV